MSAAVVTPALKAISAAVRAVARPAATQRPPVAVRVAQAMRSGLAARPLRAGLVPQSLRAGLGPESAQTGFGLDPPAHCVRPWVAPAP
jgi:hypothetical protein